MKLNEWQEVATGVEIMNTMGGSGSEMVEKGDLVEIRYSLNGENSKPNGMTFQDEVHVGKHGIPKGWNSGLIGMKLYGHRTIKCAPNMAFGKKCSPPFISKEVTVVFDVELLKFID